MISCHLSRSKDNLLSTPIRNSNGCFTQWSSTRWYIECRKRWKAWNENIRRRISEFNVYRYWTVSNFWSWWASNMNSWNIDDIEVCCGWDTRISNRKIHTRYSLLPLLCIEKAFLIRFVSILIDVKFAPFASVYSPLLMVAVRRRRLGETRLFFASRSLKTQSDSFDETTDDETGINSICETGPERTATVASPARPWASDTTNRYTHIAFLYFAGRAKVSAFTVIHDSTRTEVTSS